MRVKTFFLLLLGSLSLLGGCADKADSESSSAAARVMIIGLDGTRAEALDLAHTPNLDRLRLLGQTDLNAITGDVSLSGPGWASMLSGVWCDKHQVVDNDVSWGNSQFDRFPHFIRRVEQQQPDLRTVSVSHWAAINDEILCADEAGDDCGPTDRVVNTDSDAQVRDVIVDELRNADPHVLFMQFDDIDHAGHGTPPASPPGGFCPYPEGDIIAGEENGLCSPANFNPEYVATLELTDEYIGDILDALFARPDFHAENWLIMVSPDHGGGGVVFNQHGFPQAQDRRTFLIFAANELRPFPVDAQLKIVDVTASALFHLGIVPEPDWQLDGQAIGLPGAPAYVDTAIPTCYDPAVFNPDSGRS